MDLLLFDIPALHVANELEPEEVVGLQSQTPGI